MIYASIGPDGSAVIDSSRFHRRGHRPVFLPEICSVNRSLCYETGLCFIRTTTFTIPMSCINDAVKIQRNIPIVSPFDLVVDWLELFPDNQGFRAIRYLRFVLGSQEWVTQLYLIALCPLIQTVEVQSPLLRYETSGDEVVASDAKTAEDRTTGWYFDLLRRGWNFWEAAHRLIDPPRRIRRVEEADIESAEYRNLGGVV